MNPADGGGDRSGGAGSRGALPRRRGAGPARSRRRADLAQPRKLVGLPAGRPEVPGAGGQFEPLAPGSPRGRPLGGVRALHHRCRRPPRSAPGESPALSAPARVPPPGRTQHAGFRGDALGHLPQRGLGHRDCRSSRDRDRVAAAPQRDDAHRIHQPDFAPHHGRRAVGTHREPRKRRRIRRAGHEPERDARAHRDADGRRAQGLGQRRPRSAHPRSAVCAPAWSSFATRAATTRRRRSRKPR